MECLLRGTNSIFKRSSDSIQYSKGWRRFATLVTTTFVKKNTFNLKHDSWYSAQIRTQDFSTVRQERSPLQSAMFCVKLDIPPLFRILKPCEVTLLHTRNKFVTLYYNMTPFLCEIKIPASSLFEYELYVSVRYIKRANITFITKYVLRNWNVNIGVYKR
jgi:hypothetical protein